MSTHRNRMVAAALASIPIGILGGWMASIQAGSAKAYEKEREWERNVQQEIRARLDRGEQVIVDDMLKLRVKDAPVPPSGRPD